MLTPIKSVSLQFTSDGTSTALVFDLTATPLNLDLRGGLQPLEAQDLTLVGPGNVPIGGATLAIVGTIATLTLAAPLAQSVLGVLQVYTVAFLLALSSITPAA
jgi:hypothetical protein